MNPSARRVTWAIVAAGCTARLLTHDPDMAAVSALEFAKVVLVTDATERGYAMLADEAQRATPLATFREFVSRMHPRGRPYHLQAIEFERVPGQDSISIFLQGSSGEESFFYRLSMQGSADRGYRVSGLWRGNGPYPPSRLREKLDVVRAI